MTLSAAHHLSFALATFNQAPDTSADLWFVVAQGLLALLLVVAGWVFSRLAAQVSRLADRVDQLEKESLKRQHEMQLEIATLTQRLEHHAA